MAGFWLAAMAVMMAPAPGRVTLREASRSGDATRTVVSMKAEGLYRPGPPPGSTAPTSEKAARPLTLKVETRFAFDERVLAVAEDGSTRRAARRVVQAASAINGEIRPLSATIRPAVMTLVVEARQDGPFALSPAGPLTRPELELVQGPGDPLALAALLPGKPVAPGDRWTVADAAARSVSGYDALASNRLGATLETLDDDEARVKLDGTIAGAALGGEGTMTCSGSFVFDRNAARVSRLDLTRAEVRKAGPVEAGLDLQGTLGVTRVAGKVPKELADAALAALSTEPDPALERLRFTSADGRYTLLHDRDWHTYWDDERVAVLKRVDRGELVGQCNLNVGPKVAPGRHQDLVQFRDDIRRALGPRFGQFLGFGNVDGAPAGGFRHKVEVRGREGDVGIIWYYYLVAGPEGDQLLVTFTLGQGQVKAFGDQDARLIGSLEWTTPPPEARP